MEHKCLLLFNFYVTSIKYHKPFHLDDMDFVTKRFIHGFEDEVALATKPENTHTHTHARVHMWELTKVRFLEISQINIRVILKNVTE